MYIKTPSIIFRHDICIMSNILWTNKLLSKYSVTVNTYIHTYVYVMKTAVNFNDVHCKCASNKLNVDQSRTTGKAQKSNKNFEQKVQAL